MTNPKIHPWKSKDLIDLNYKILIYIDQLMKITARNKWIDIYIWALVCIYMYSFKCRYIYIDFMYYTYIYK